MALTQDSGIPDEDAVYLVGQESWLDRVPPGLGLETPGLAS